MSVSRRAVTGLSLVLLVCVTGLAGCGRSTSDNKPASDFDAANVPEELRDIAPLAKRWGIGDDAMRADALARASQGERDALRQAVHTHGAAITGWLDSFGSGAEMSNEAAAFMYMQLAVEELPP